MATKRKSSMSAVNSALAKQKEDFDKAVEAEVELRMSRVGSREFIGDLERKAGETYGEMAEKKYSDNKALNIAIRKTISDANVAHPTSQFVGITNELMAKISHLADTVDSVVEKIKPVLSPETPTAGSPTNTAPCQVSSEFVEFIECAGRRIDRINNQLSEVMGRITL